MTEKKPFTLPSLESVPKPDTPERTAQAEQSGKQLGFVDREGHGNRGRRRSPRTRQLHAWVLPEVAAAIAEMAAVESVPQGVIVQRAWQALKRQPQ